MSHTKKTKEHKANQQWTEKMLMLLLADSLIILISYFTALLLRFDFVFSSIPEEYLIGYLWSMPFWIISTVVVFISADCITASGGWQVLQSFR